MQNLNRNEIENSKIIIIIILIIIHESKLITFTFDDEDYVFLHVLDIVLSVCYYFSFYLFSYLLKLILFF